MSLFPEAVLRNVGKMKLRGNYWFWTYTNLYPTPLPASSLVTRVLLSPQCEQQSVWGGRKRLHRSCEIQWAAHSPLSSNLSIWASHAWADGDKRRQSETFSHLSSRLSGWLARSLVACFALQNEVEIYLCTVDPSTFRLVEDSKRTELTNTSVRDSQLNGGNVTSELALSNVGGGFLF